MRTAAILAALVAAVGGTRASGSTVRVTVGGNRCTVSTKIVPVGPVIFVISNRGSSLGDFAVAGARTRLLRPGRTATLTVDLSKAGSYSYRCTASHRAGRLTASPPAPLAPQKLAFTQLASGLG